MSNATPDRAIPLDFPLIFHNPGIAALPAHAVEFLPAQPEENQPATLTIRLDWAIFQKIRTLELFHLTADSRPEEANDDVFDPDEHLFLDLRPAGDLEPLLATDDPAVVLRTTRHADPLFAIDNWFVLSIWQPIALGEGLSGHTLRAGYQTKWDAPPPEPAGPPPTGPLFQAVTAYFKSAEWPYERLEPANILRLEFKGGYGDWYCYAQVLEREEQFAFYSACPLHAPAGRRAAVSELLTRINFGMIIGNFEMDMDDGEIRYKTSVDVEGSELTPAMIRQLVHANVTMMDRYLPAIVQVINDTATPLQAVIRIEI